MKTGNSSIILCMLIDNLLAFCAGSRGSMPVWLYVIISSVVVVGATLLLSFPKLTYQH